MSVEITAEVWAYSVQTGNGLLLMVRLGDFSDKHGFSWPGEEELAKSVRCDIRTIKRLIKKAESDDELIVFRGTKQGNRYVVIVGCSEDIKKMRLGLAEPKVGTRKIGDKMAPKKIGDKTSKGLRTSDANNAAIGDKAMSPDPLSVDPSVDPPSPPAPKKQVKPLKDSPWNRLIVEHSFGIAFEAAATSPSITGQVHNILRALGAEKATLEETRATYEDYESRANGDFIRMKKPETVATAVVTYRNENGHVPNDPFLARKEVH